MVTGALSLNCLDLLTRLTWSGNECRVGKGRCRMRMLAATLIIVAELIVPRFAQAKSGAMHPLKILPAEPPIGKMRMRQVIFVDDHICPPGEVKMVVAPDVFNGPRTRSCVPH